MLLASPLDGTWIKTDASSKYEQVIITSTPEGEAIFSIQYQNRVTEIPLILLGSTADDKAAKEHGYVVKKHISKGSHWKTDRYFISQIGDEIEMKLIAIYETGNRSPHLLTYYFKKKP